MVDWFCLFDECCICGGNATLIVILVIIGIGGLVIGMVIGLTWNGETDKKSKSVKGKLCKKCGEYYPLSEYSCPHCKIKKPKKETDVMKGGQ